MLLCHLASVHHHSTGRLGLQSAGHALQDGNSFISEIVQSKSKLASHSMLISSVGGVILKAIKVLVLCPTLVYEFSSN